MADSLPLVFSNAEIEAAICRRDDIKRFEDLESRHWKLGSYDVYPDTRYDYHDAA